MTSGTPTAPSGSGPLVVISTAVDPTHTTITLVDLDGTITAQASAAPGDDDAVPFPGSAAAGSPSGMADPSLQLAAYTQPRPPNAGVCCDAFLPTISTSTTRVYFADGLTSVRFLARDGSTGLATSLPNVANRARAIFAVSPDDRRIAVSVFDWSSRPMRVRIYVEDLQGGGHHVEIFSSSTIYEWPVGWHAGNLVLGGGPALGGAPNPYAASWYHLVDPGTGNRLAVMGGMTCPAVGPLSPAGTACIAARCQCIMAVDWSGTQTPTYVYHDPSEGNWAALSPDGHAVIFSENYGTPTGGGIWRNGSVTFIPDYGASPDRWLDGTHTLVSCSSGSGQCLSVRDLGSGARADFTTSGLVAGQLPGGL